MTGFVELAGWIAAGFTLAAYSMRTMIPLRVAALGASLFFILYGYLSAAYPIMVLHLVLLPFNTYRLVELLRLIRKARAAEEAAFSLSWIRPYVRPIRLKPRDLVFRKGERPDAMYFLARGRVLLEEIDTVLEPGEIFGEIAFFTRSKQRTLTARCIDDCEVMALNEADFMRLYAQNPTFGLYVMRLVASRLMEGVAKHPGAYAPTHPPR